MGDRKLSRFEASTPARGKAMRGMPERGAAWTGKARRCTARSGWPLSGAVWHVAAWLGAGEEHTSGCESRTPTHGVEWQRRPGHVGTGSGEERRGLAWPGLVWQGAAWGGRMVSPG